jgi:hypothetical protein
MRAPTDPCLPQDPCRLPADAALAVASLAVYRGDPAVHLAINQILGADLELVRTFVAGHSGG